MAYPPIDSNNNNPDAFHNGIQSDSYRIIQRITTDIIFLGEGFLIKCELVSSVVYSLL